MSSFIHSCSLCLSPQSISIPLTNPVCRPFRRFSNLSYKYYVQPKRCCQQSLIYMNMTKSRGNNSSEEWLSDSTSDKQSHKRNKRLNQSRESMELNWRFSTQKNQAPKQCKKCDGTGQIECSWCHATGVLMLGDRLMCSTEGQCHCLACQNGQIVCKACKGTGKLASWMLSD